MAIHEEERCERRDDDDGDRMATVILHAPLFQRRESLMQSIHCAIDIGPDDPVHVAYVCVFQVSCLCDSCIAYDHIDGSPSKSSGHSFGYGREIPDISNLEQT